VGLIGAGAVGAQHARLLIQRVPALEELRVHDVVNERAASLCHDLEREASERDVKLLPVAAARAAADDAGVLIACTTTRRSYIERSWLAPGVVAVNVSLDDLSEEVLLTADRLYVDDWDPIRADEHRLLGRLARAGKVSAPGGPGGRPGARAVTGTLGDLFLGKCPGRAGDDDVIVVNPFGLSIEDIAMARLVYQVARQRGLGLLLPT
jgi:ornithine cyclodeaminase